MVRWSVRDLLATGRVDRKSTAMTVCATELAGVIASLFLAEEDRGVDGESTLGWNPRCYQAEYRHG